MKRNTSIAASCIVIALVTVPFLRKSSDEVLPSLNLQTSQVTKSTPMPSPVGLPSESRDTVAAPKAQSDSFEALWEEMMQNPSDRDLIMEDFRKRGGTFREDVVDWHILGIVRDRFKGDQTAFDLDLKNKGLTYDQFRNQTRDDLIVFVIKTEVSRGLSGAEEKKYALEQWLAQLREKAGFPKSRSSVDD
jgi:hypothetical protein